MSKGKWAAIAGAVIIGLMVIGGLSETETSTSSGSDPVDVAVEQVEEIIEDASSGFSSDQENAVDKAENYLSFSGFSRKGLIEQLEFEGFTTADATFAVDNITVNWNEQAARKAEQYLDGMSFSRSGLQEQLEFEGFTPAQAAYGVSAAY
jgi:hypothetical protein